MMGTLNKTHRLNTSPHYADPLFREEQTVFGEQPKSPHRHVHLRYDYSDTLV